MKSQKLSLDILNHFHYQAEYLDAPKMVIQILSNFQSSLVKFSWINYGNRSSFYSDQIKNQVTTLTGEFYLNLGFLESNYS
jgi:hypothetical protein